MSSYYNKVEGNLKPREIARVEDIHQIQQNIREAIQNLIKDNLGISYILGESENTFKLVPTTDYIDQFNYYNGKDDGTESCWVSFYDIYLKQDIEIEKSSIENITVHMRNQTNISVTIFAEIRDDDFHLISEANAVLDPLEKEEKYTPITFAFNKHHLPVGHYYFIIRPVDISVTDLVFNEGDDNIWYNSQIKPEHFQVRYDANGTYNKDFEITINNIDDDEDDITINNTNYGLQASYDGTNYLDAIHLEEIEGYIDIDEYTKNDNIDLFFEETYSSGLTYLLSEPGAAIINGEKVESFDTHIHINDPSDQGDRIDLVMLTPQGELKVLEGKIGGDIYPVTNENLPIAYIKLYKNGEKVALIEQDDENGITRHRDILERIRRLEKKINYQVENNTPSRIKYTCEVDPIMYNDGLSQGTIDTEASYNTKLGTNSNGQPIVTNEETDSLIWSIIKGTYKYSHEETTKTSAYVQVFNVDMKAGQSGSPSSPSNGLYRCLLSESNLQGNSSVNINKPIKGQQIKVEIKKSKSVKYSKTVTTNSKGQATLNLRNAKLSAGSYIIVSTIDGQTIQTTLKIHSGSYTVTSSGSKVKKVTLKDKAKVTTTESIKNKGIAYGDEGFIKDNISVDTTNGIIQIAKQDNKKGKYIKNKALVDSKTSKPYYKSEIVEYTINNNKESLKSEFPVLHLHFTRDTHIKSITPYVKKFKNIKNFGILLFQNDQILNQKNKKRTLIEKNFNKDAVYPNIFKGSKNVTGKADKSGVVVLDSYKTFKTDIKLKAGTYSLVIFAKLKDNSSEGKIYLREFDTYGNLEEYGMSAKSTGSSNLSLLKMHTSNLTSRSWNVVFEQKPDIYFEQGTVTSASKILDGQIKSCRPYFKNNLINPTNACNYKLQVSNNGGSTWEDAEHGKTVNFKSLNNVFKWRLTLTGDKKHTPRLVYNKKLQYAIKFSVKEQSTYVEYEDFKRCYQTPLFNAQYITRALLKQNSVNVTNRFSEWEFARIFMEDDSDETNIDICFSYNDEDFKTNVSTYRENWDSRTFFSQIFADLKLSDFNTSSVDYDNYEGNVEFDEHNYPFKVDPSALMHESGAGGHAIANFTANETSQFKYGNINNDNIAPLVDEWFVYEDVINDYKYTYLAPEEEKQYAGAVLTKGPYELATFSPKDTSVTSFDAITDDNKSSYIINGVRFKDPVYLKDTDILTLQIYATRANGEGFPAGTFEVVVSLSEDGSLFTDNTNGMAYPINSVLEHNQYNSVGVYLTTNIEGYATSGIRSIGIRVKKPEELKVGDSIGIGFISTYGYNRRPYVPYLYSGDWSRLKWQPLVPQAKAYNLIKSQSESSGYWYEFYYSMQDNNPNSSTENNIQTDGFSQYACHFYGTSSHFQPGGDGEITAGDFSIKNMKRNRGKFTATMQRKNNGDEFTCESSTIGNTVILDFPAQQTGDIFKIDMNLPLTIYDLISVQYYVYNTRAKTNESEDRGMDDSPIYRINEDGFEQDDNYKYKYYGHFSKGDIKIKLYTERDTSNTPAETLNLPPWGRTSQNATITDKTVNAWFKKRSDAPIIKSMVIERQNPTGQYVEPIKLVIKDIMFYNADVMPALGPQMLMRIYPKEGADRDTLQIRKTGGIWRL